MFLEALIFYVGWICLLLLSTLILRGLWNWYWFMFALSCLDKDELNYLFYELSMDEIVQKKPFIERKHLSYERFCFVRRLLIFFRKSH